MVFEVAVLLPSFFVFDVKPNRCASYEIDDIKNRQEKHEKVLGTFFFKKKGVFLYREKCWMLY